MQKSLLWIIIILVVVGGGYFLLSTQTATAPSEDEMMEDAMMEMEEESAMPEGAMMEDGTITEEEAMMQDDTMTEESASETVVISYTEEGYAPANVTIKKGDTVRFVNNATSQETWPASAVHPTHTVYPEKSASDCLGSSFDACRGLKAGESWEFTFNSAGEWRFHDHMHPSQTGTVIVTE